MQERNKTLTGVYLRQDIFGRLFFDTCETDNQHLTSILIAEGDDRPRCRAYFDNPALLGDLINKKGTFEVTVRFVPEG